MNTPLNPLYLKWKQIIEDWEQTGLTQAYFCNQKHLSLSQFKYFRTRLNTLAKANQIVATIPNSVPTKTSFAPVQINSAMPVPKSTKVNAATSQPSLTCLRLILSSGLVLELPLTLPPNHLKNILAVAQSC